ncbi:uncharacterized protein LOC132706108 isoform X2 [Cylas formicarius]|nr:uncharacterized protein LOC132706108 isoform X2 [Cylas formicarius]
MVMCNAMESIVIPRPPALPLGPLASMPNKRSSPPFPTTNADLTQNNESNTALYEERKFTQKLVENSKLIFRNESVRSKISTRSATSQHSNGFRLRDTNNNGLNNGLNDKEDTGSIYSVYKQKIDSMFESDSSVSHGSNHNSVQAKIEKMFSDVAKESGIPPNQIGLHSFSVDYLGSTSLQDKVTSLDGLQNPLRELYFSYKKHTKPKQKLSGRLEISSQGLRVQYQGVNGDLEQMNSFPTIAVWSAVKFVIQESSSGLCYAFLPLITDPDNMDKQMLFRNLEGAEKKYVHVEDHSPLFAVVMRKIGVQKQLECHGFVCQTSEDAIVIAATLYKSLVSHMKNKEVKPKNRNGVTTCMSTASSIVEKSNGSVPVRPPRKKRSSASSIASDTNSITNVSDTPLPSSLNEKSPKKSIKTKRAPDAPKHEDLDAILPYEEPITISKNGLSNDGTQEGSAEVKPKTFSDKVSTYMSEEQKMLAAEMKQVVCDPDKGLKRAQSLRKRDEDQARKKENSGDILTKVTIPRSGSFLNTGGLTRYKNKASRNNDSAGGGSPLGFQEIFHELSLQEGLHSMDEILSVIIDPDGMSFNDLKPIYKEFLLKLAVTFTKDELYQKSKSIMRRQKKRLVKRSPSIKRNQHKLVANKFKKLKHIFQKNPKTASKNNPDESRKNSGCSIETHINQKLAESSISTSSYDTRQFRPKEEFFEKRPNFKKKGELRRTRRRDRTSTSEESDFLSLRRQQKLKNRNTNLPVSNQNRNSSSGYVSWSECSCDSDSCECDSAEKCYCSLGQRNFEGRRRAKCMCNEDIEFCGCDTDSCSESNKCYCQYVAKRRQRRGSGFDVSPLSHQKLCKKSSNTKSSRSLEYMSNPSESYYEKLRSKSKYGSERTHSYYRNNSLKKKRRNSHLGVSTVQEEFDVGGEKLSAMDHELIKLMKRGNFEDTRVLQEAFDGARFGDSFGDYWAATRGYAAPIKSNVTTG